MSKSKFRNALEHLINCESMENGSNTPDWILADYLAGCLENFDKTMQAREKWYGREIHDKTTPVPYFSAGSTMPVEGFDPRKEKP